MKTFNFFTPELLTNPEIRQAVKVPSIFGDKKETCYSATLSGSSLWIQKTFAQILGVPTSNQKVIEAESAKNLSKLFDTLKIKTWATNIRTPQPSADKTKAGVVKTFLYALNNNDYDILSVLEKYLELEKDQDYVSLFQQYLQDAGEPEAINYYLTQKEEMGNNGNGFNAEASYSMLLTGYGYGTTKNIARQKACKDFLKKNDII